MSEHLNRGSECHCTKLGTLTQDLMQWNWGEAQETHILRKSSLLKETASYKARSMKEINFLRPKHQISSNKYYLIILSHKFLLIHSFIMFTLTFTVFTIRLNHINVALLMPRPIYPFTFSSSK